MIFRAVSTAIILCLVMLNVFLYGHNLGYRHGYTVAMGDIVLGYNTTENFFLNQWKQ